MSEWRTEFQYLLDRKILNSAELGYLFGQIKSIIDRETDDLQSQLAKFLWIPVSEKPKINKITFLSEKMLCLSKMGFAGIFYYRKNDKWQSVDTGQQVSYITYYMPIPPLPDKETNEYRRN